MRERAVQRRLAQVATEIAETALAPTGKDVGQLLDEAESKIFQIAESGARKDQGLIGISPVLAKVSSASTTSTARRTLPTSPACPPGFVDLDRMTAGLQPGDLIIVAGAPVDGQDRASRSTSPSTSRCIRASACRWRSSAWR